MAKDPTARFQAVTPKRLTAAIADQIEQMILDGDLSAGDTLPAERELAVQFGVSRNVLREAVGILVQKGLLEVRPGSGTYVTVPGVEFVSDNLNLLVRFNTKAMIELVEARRSLEVEIVGLAAQRASEDDFEAINRCILQMEEAEGDPEAYVDADIRFHEALAVAAKNQILRILLMSTRAALRENIGVLAIYHPTARLEAIQHHKIILDAVRRHADEDARSAMRNHLNGVENNLRDLEASNKT